MADPYVRQATGVFVATTGSVAVTAGDAVYAASGVMEKADASDATKYAEAIAVDSYAVGETGVYCRTCIIVDTDAPYTKGDQYFLSETAGAITATRPTTAASLRQCLGFGISTRELYVDIPPVKELNVPLVVTGATSAFVLIDTGNFGGESQDAQNELCTAVAMIPENCVGLEIAYLWYAAEATVGTPTFDITVGSAVDGAQHDAVTADATLANQAREGAAADEMQMLDITTGFDATNIWRPGALVSLKALQDDAGTDISVIFTGNLVCKVV